MPTLEQMQRARLRREAFLSIEVEHGNALPNKRIAELMAERGLPVSNCWPNHMKTLLKKERGELIKKRTENKKKPKGKPEQQVLLPEKDALHVVIGSLVKAMKHRSIERLVVRSTGDVTIESVESFNVGV